MAEKRDELTPEDQIARLLALQIRLSIGNQAQTIVELGRLGFGSRRIAELLGTTQNTANVTLQKAKKAGANR